MKDVGTGPSPPAHIRPPARLDAVLHAYLDGSVGLESVRRELSNCLDDPLNPSDHVLTWLEAAWQSGMVTDAVYLALATDMQGLDGEVTPTEFIVEEVKQDATPDPPAISEPTSVVGATSPKAGPEPGPGDLLGGRFELEARVPGGGMGDVFRATDRLKAATGYGDPTIAVKLLERRWRDRPDARQLLEHEAIVTQRLTHPNIVNVFDFHRSEQHFFVTMEWLRGETLADRLATIGDRPMPWDEFDAVLRGVGAGLEYAHRQGVVHGDVKPGNVYLTTDAGVKLLDFGMPVPASAVEGGTRLIPASRAYASCEVLAGHEPTIRDDVYSLSCMAYRMLTGSPPFGDRNAREAEHANVSALRPKGLARSQWATLRRGLAFRRRDRLNSVQGLLDGLSMPAAGWSQSRAWVAVGLVAFLLIGGWWLFGLPGGMKPPGEGPVQWAGDSPQHVASFPASADPVMPAVLEEPPTAAPVPQEPAVAVASHEPKRKLEPVALSASTQRRPVPVDVQPVTAGPDTASDGELLATPRRPLGFSSEQYTVTEADGFVALSLRHPTELAEPLTLQIVLEAQTAEPEADYMTPGKLTLIAEPGGALPDILVPLVADAVPEHIEIFIARIETGDSNVELGTAEAVVVIIDDDRPVDAAE